MTHNRIEFHFNHKSEYANEVNPGVWGASIRAEIEGTVYDSVGRRLDALGNEIITRSYFGNTRFEALQQAQQEFYYLVEERKNSIKSYLGRYL